MSSEGSREFQCTQCKNTFRTYRSRKPFCSADCYHRHQREAVPERSCPQCGQSFRPKIREHGKLQAYCSAACSSGHKTAENHPNWTGGRGIGPDGYVRVRTGPNTRQREHREVAAATLGRPLRPDEHVHHMNGDKTDNRPENLEVLSVREHALRHPPEKAPPRLIECPRCHRERLHHAKGMCRSCYTRTSLEARIAANPEEARARVLAQKAASYRRRKAAHAQP